MLQATGAVGMLGTVGIASGNEGSDSEPYIVGTSGRKGRDEARQRADSVRHVLHFGDTGWAVAGEFSEEARKNLRRRNDVRYVEEDGEVEAIGHSTDEDDGDPAEEQVLPWGIDRVDADVAHHDGETGGGSSVAIIDTGIDPGHETLEVTGGEAFVSCLGLGCEEDWDDDQGHGTHCAGTADALDSDVGVVGVSTDADLYAVKVLDALGTGSMSDVAAGIEWTADQGIDVGSLSLGGGDSETLRDACKYAQREGTLLVAAAGNDGPDEDSVSYPAAYDECLAVSATTEDDDIASFSSRGEEVELAAPGADVLSSLPGDDYDRWDGTSMACPHVSGAAAQLMEDGYANGEARERLNETAEDIGLADTEQGNGLLDVAAALGIE
ncbi:MULTISPECIES: S8 family peptidase [Natrialbaceae]|uniref:S8 family peptidase n=1 Tax=Natrialbaceae TaxID=1644061 RepID=UPI00207C9548|nr:S8 family peptidase [Natronococcus sp. CG52]